MLTPDQQAFLDKIKNGDDTQEGTKRALIKDKMYLWPKAKVYYNFDKGVGMYVHKLFCSAIIIPQTLLFSISSALNTLSVKLVLVLYMLG